MQLIYVWSNYKSAIQQQAANHTSSTKLQILTTSLVWNGHISDITDIKKSKIVLKC